MAVNLHERDIRVEAKKQGREEGAHDKAVETACNLLKNNISIDIIANSTGLSIEEVTQLDSELNF